MLKIITSLSAEKRLDYLIKRLSELTAEAVVSVVAKEPVLIVPEQFLFETERTMYRLLGGRKIAVTEITGFSKLAAAVAEKYGTPKLYADDIVKTVTMYKTLSRLGKAANYDAADGMLSVIADFKAAAVTPSFLREKAANAVTDFSVIDSVLSQKLADISEIYSAYSETLEADFADRLDDNRIAADLIRLNGCFAGKEVFLYEFDSFSASQMELIKALSDCAENVEILFRADVKSNETDWSVKRVKRQLAVLGCDFQIADLGGEAYSPELKLLNAAHISDECEFVAAEIRRLITKEGYSCNDIAVLLCGDDNSVNSRLREALAEYDIQPYSDLPEPIISKPMTRFIISALEAVELDTPQLLAYIRSGFVRVRADLEVFGRPLRLTAGKTDGSLRDKRFAFAKSGSRITKKLSKRSMDLLERVARRYALTKREWRNPFPEQNNDLYGAEPLRREITEPLIRLRKACDAPCITGDKITEALCEFLLETMQLHRTVQGLCVNKSITDEFRQLWDLIIDVFESLHAALKDFPLSLRDYTELLRGVFSKTNIAKPPAVLDAVAIGDPRRSRLNKVKVVFITGANSGSFPKTAGLENSYAFSGRDIDVLSESGLEIHPNFEERYYFERLMVNRALTLPSEKLYLSAPLSDAAWEETLPSPVIAELAEKHGLEIKKTWDLPLSSLSFRACTVKAARRIFAEENAAVLKEIVGNYDGIIDNKADNYSSTACAVILPETAEKLFNLGRFSPTKIESMMGCRFKFFCEYGLGLDIPKLENEEEPLAYERGLIIHYCLDRVLRFLSRNDIADCDLEGFVEDCIREYRNLKLKLPQGYAQTKRQWYMQMGLKAGILRMVRHIRDEFTDSGWKPRDFEKDIDYPLTDNIRITGKIDRVDVKTDEDGKNSELVRVIDYKAGGKEMDFPTVFYGLNMQMLLYLFAVSEKTMPSAALYLPSNGAKVKDFVVPAPGIDITREMNKIWLSSHKPSGIMIEDSPGKSTLKLQKLNPAEYDRLKNYCEKLISAQVSRVKRGNVQAFPLGKSAGASDICVYCEFSAACGKSKIKVMNRNYIERILRDNETNMD